MSCEAQADRDLGGRGDDAGGDGGNEMLAGEGSVDGDGHVDGDDNKKDDKTTTSTGTTA